MRAERPHLLHKVIAMEGDITKPELGLSASDQEALRHHVSVVFHSAATVRFDEPLRSAVAMNIEGTRRLVELCRGMRHLVSFVHVSTAYSNCDRHDIREELYDPPYDPEQFVNTVNLLDDATLTTITPKLLGERPNTYTLTKALAESLLAKLAKDLPVSIVRPSIVTAALREPLPGWVDNINGPTGLIAGAGKGILRTIWCYRDLVADIVPVDLCINLMLAVAWHTANSSKPPLPRIYQFTSGAQNPMYWRDLEKHGYESLVERPYSGILWYPGGSFKSSRLVNSVCSTVQHDIPAILVDAGFRLMRKKPFMTNIQRRMHKAATSLEFFTTHEWNFSDANVQSLLKELSPEDFQTFNFDIKAVHWADYIERYVEGTRLFVLKEGPEIDAQSRIRLRRMHILHKTVQIMFILLCFRLIAPQRMKSAVRILIGLLLFATNSATHITNTLLLGLSKAFAAL